jgi:hypothetical protein|tara:strand:- start:138 stop:398 length:261 start_codon:yes stop_codon:yes gene_type:complete
MGLWDNIRARRASGKKMRKKGEKGAPTPAAMASASEDASAMTTTANIPNPATTAMGPTPFLDKRRKKEKSVMLKRFKKYFEDKGVF